MLAHGPNQEQLEWEEDEDGFEYTAELAGLSRHRSLSPIPTDSTQPLAMQAASGADARRKTVLKQTRSLDTYQMYPTAVSSTTRRGSVGASTAADMYRLSFVDISDSSNEEEESGYMSRPVSIHTVFPIDPATGGNNSTEEDDASEERLWLGKKGTDSSRECLVGARSREEGNRDTDPHSPESIPNVSIGQCSDLQYDDEGFTQPILNHNRPNTPNQGRNTAAATNPSAAKGHQNTDECRHVSEPLLPPTKHKHTEIDSTHPQTKNPMTKDDKSSTNTAKEVNTVQSKVVSMDHASFSPLYNMSVSHLNHTVQLLETKLQGIKKHRTL